MALFSLRRLRPVTMMSEPERKGALLELARTLVRELEGQVTSIAANSVHPWRRSPDAATPAPVDHVGLIRKSQGEERCPWQPTFRGVRHSDHAASLN